MLNFSIFAAGVALGCTAGAVGVLFGKVTLQHMSQTVFERLTWFFIGTVGSYLSLSLCLPCSLN